MVNRSVFFLKNITDLNFTMLEVKSEKSAQKAKVNFFEKVLVRTNFCEVKEYTFCKVINIRFGRV